MEDHNDIITIENFLLGDTKAENAKAAMTQEQSE